jgi:hypothetical protein
MKEKAARRSKKHKLIKAKWDPQIDDLVLVKRQTISDATAGLTSKFTK